MSREAEFNDTQIHVDASRHRLKKVTPREYFQTCRHAFLNAALHRFVGLALYLVLLSTSPLTFSRDHVVERAWLDDPTGMKTWADVRRELGTPFTGAISRGFGESALWVRLRIDPTGPGRSGQANDLVLRLRPVYLDEIRVFDPLAPEGRVRVLGDRHHPRLDELQGRDFLLPLARGDAPRDLWLRVTSTSTRQIYAEVLDSEDLTSSVLRHDLFASLYLGLVLTMVAWGLASWALQKEALMGAFAYKEFTALLFGLSSLGFLRALWPSAWSAELLDRLGSIFSILAVSGAILFHVLFLAEFKPARWAIGILKAGLFICLATMAMVAQGSVLLALKINMSIILIGPFVCAAAALSAKAWHDANPARRPTVPRKVVLLFYLLICVLLVVASTTALAWAPATGWTIYISQIHGLLTGTLVLLMLQYRNHMIKAQRQDDMRALELASMQAEHERRTRDEQGKLLAMLAHEIKTPLATMHLRLDTAGSGHREIRQAMRDMNAVIDRCVQAARMGDAALVAKTQSHDLTKIVRDAASACAQPERVRTDIPDQLDIETDIQLLAVILNNLLENACKYSMTDSVITLNVAAIEDPALGPAMRLEIRNRPGTAGFPDPARVFNKYYRSPAAQRQAGTGLGLYLVRSLAQVLGGRISYLPDTESIGFVLTLPLAQLP